MREMDLIPPEYRSQQTRRKLSLSICGACAVLASLLVFSAATTRQSIADLRVELAAREAARAALQSQAVKTSAMQNQLGAAEELLVRLQELRSGVSASSVLDAVHRAIADQDIWFTDWEFARRGVVNEATTPRAVETGYFIVTPAGELEPQSAALVETRMKIRGHASDHSALAEFVRALLAEPQISDVRVIRTFKQTDGRSAYLTFDVSVILQTPVST